MDHVVDLDAVADLLRARRKAWAASGLAVGNLTWRDAAATWPQPIVTDRSTVAEPESLGFTLRCGAQEAELVFWTGGWADLTALIGGKVVAEAPEFTDSATCVAVADQLVARLLQLARQLNQQPAGSRAARRFLGYLHAQKTAITGASGAHTNRPELAAVHGYDTKHAMHALRLGLQGIELLTTGRITLPVPEPRRSYVRAIRRGEIPLPEVVGAVTDAESRLARVGATAACPPSRTGAGSTIGSIAATSSTGPAAVPNLKRGPCRRSPTPEQEIRTRAVHHAALLVRTRRWLRVGHAKAWRALWRTCAVQADVIGVLLLAGGRLSRGSPMDTASALTADSLMSGSS